MVGPSACSFVMRNGNLEHRPRPPVDALTGIPFDRPVVGYGGKTVNTLRLWGAAAPDDFDFRRVQRRRVRRRARRRTLVAESLTRVLYPDDSTIRGRALRFVQEYFLVACSLADRDPALPARSMRTGHRLPDKVAIQLNDTHPSLAVAELMRILLDEAHLGWDEAWDLTQRTLAYTNHTLLPEALEKMAAGDVRADCCRATWRSSSRSTGASSTTCARASRRRCAGLRA